ncbi:MAG TPA: hypothetical protein VFU02_25035 [Polyangiaceae bacterium]|nr:hypothetical protein [Polyangiaceae bacterium]
MADQLDLELKRISHDAVPQAIDKAGQYRLLNDPELAESICLDVLAVDPTNQKNLKTLILAISDQFANSSSRVGPRDALLHVEKLASEYERLYYTGLVAEREARAFLGRTHATAHAFFGFRQAMSWYEKADALAPAGNNDARLRYNTCVRTIQREHLEAPPASESELPLE